MKTITSFVKESLEQANESKSFKLSGKWLDKFKELKITDKMKAAAEKLLKKDKDKAEAAEKGLVKEGICADKFNNDMWSFIDYMIAKEIKDSDGDFDGRYLASDIISALERDCPDLLKEWDEEELIEKIYDEISYMV